MLGERQMTPDTVYRYPKEFSILAFEFRQNLVE
jgi:hypothetical protein